MRVLSGANGTTSDIIKGIDWIITNHSKRKGSKGFRGSVASMSIGSKDRSLTIEEVVKRASSVGIHFSVSAGNENQDACNASPGAASKGTDVVTVGSVNAEDRRSDFSNFGPCVTVYAPGEFITSTWIGGFNATNTLNGTSMACPHISGLMAVLLAQNPNLSTAEMKQKLIYTAQAITLDTGGSSGFLANNGHLGESD